MHLQETEFEQYFTFLKALWINDCGGWDDRTSYKEHTDIRGVKIEKGEKYFDITIKRKTLKFSKQSMDEYLFLMFEGTPLLQYNAKKLLEEKEEKKKKAIEKLPF